MDIESWIPSANAPSGHHPEAPEMPAPQAPGRPLAVFEDLSPSRNWNFVQGGMPMGFNHSSSSRRRNWMLMAWSLFAAAVDLLLAFALTCFFAVGFIYVTGLSPQAVAQFFRVVFPPALALCFILVFSSYLLFFRVFAGCTLGEWACGLRLGEPRHRIANDYAGRVLQRFVFVAFTGGVTLPVLSLLTGIDWAGRLSGLPLVQHYSR